MGRQAMPNCLTQHFRNPENNWNSTVCGKRCQSKWRLHLKVTSYFRIVHRAHKHSDFVEIIKRTELLCDIIYCKVQRPLPLPLPSLSMLYCMHWYVHWHRCLGLFACLSCIIYMDSIILPIMDVGCLKIDARFEFCCRPPFFCTPIAIRGARV